MTVEHAHPAVELRQVSKWYGSFQALHGIDLKIAPGSRVVVCGPSGSGKSTLIRCLNRLEVPEEGAILIGGADVTSKSAASQAALKTTGMVFQQFNLFPHMSVLDNCTLAPRLARKEGRAQAEARARVLLERVRLADQAEKYPGQLSGGQQQRAAIARALAMDPEILLFDEPTSALDPEMVNEVLEVMIALTEERRTMICVTHEMGFARQVADRVLFMDKGALIDDAPPEAFFKGEVSDRARTFLSQIVH
ncbi:amino acid ABC transporter ATP-binding protein [Brevundimonas bacteroides]|jgi:general L-amino acid transport system ATP-binding protein|uniref:amino acid ABC transporter ATP-binding protein n=1 Tax=Brevundimonas bacteroides TaxID=74311 RepID=UPI00049562A3|nr:amino acid ABC transporter ATP-binding protein [Brevundimonas bacteroides]